jgi:hypothetical protein
LIIEQTFLPLPPVMRQNILENARAFSKERLYCWFVFSTEHLKQVPFGGNQKEYDYF